MRRREKGRHAACPINSSEDKKQKPGVKQELLASALVLCLSSQGKEGEMASLQAEKPAAPQAAPGHAKPKAAEGSKSQSSKPAAKKSEQKPRETKRKAKGGKAASKN